MPMDNQIIKNKKIELVFHRTDEHNVYLPKNLSHCKDVDFFNLFTTDADEINNWFDRFKVDSIELTINSIINMVDNTKLIIGKNDEQGLRIALKPKDGNTVVTANNNTANRCTMDNHHG
jgi:hypothetical protein